jgi:hypothetical protein
MIFFDYADDNDTLKKVLLSYLVISNTLLWGIIILERI